MRSGPTTARDRPHRGVAVTGEHQGELAPGYGLSHLLGDQTVQLEGGGHLGRRVDIEEHVREG